MKDKVPYTFELDTPKIAWLEEMVSKYDLPDAGKALRILIDHARENPTLESAIFSDIHCVDCG
jgi:hypothetical protein